MIAGCVADTSAALDRALKRLLDATPHESSAQVSVDAGVGLVLWKDSRFSGSQGWLVEQALFDGWPEGEASALIRMRGDFVVIARAAGKLLLVRGPFGGRPLYVTRVDGASIACSSLLPLAAMQRGELQLNLTYLASWIAPGIASALHAPPFHGFWTAPVGTLVSLGRARDRTDIPLEGTPSSSTLVGSDRELALRLREEFAGAVRRTTAGTRAVAVLASGGIDSSLLLATAVAEERAGVGPRVVPLTFAYGGHGDDRPHMRALAAHLGVTTIDTRAREGAPFEGRDRIVDAAIHVPLLAGCTFVANEKARSLGADTILSGEGSEWLFDASPQLFASYLLSSPVSAIQTLASFQQFGQPWSRTARTLAANVAWTKLPRLAERLRRWRARDRVTPPDWAGPRLRALAAGVRTPVPRTLCDQRERVRRAALSPHIGQAAEEHARWEQLTGIRIRMPYFDPGFVEFAARLPTRSLFAGRRERGLVREAMRDIVPESLRLRMTKARPDEAYAEAYDAVGGFEFIREHAAANNLDELGLIDGERFRREVERFSANPGAAWPDWYTLWPVLAAEAYVRWFRNFNGSLRVAD